MDGIETTTMIREREKLGGKRMPILALTAHPMPGHRARCLAAGMDDYLIKPIQPAMLLDALGQAHLGAAERPGGTGTPVLDRVALMERMGADDQLLAEIAAVFSDTSAELMARAREAIASGDAERFAAEIHTLHGMFRSLAAPAAENEVKKLEVLDLARNRDEVQAAVETLEREVRALESELSALAREPARVKSMNATKKNPGERRGRLNAQREGGARGFQG